MKRADKAARIAEILEELYPMPTAPLRHVDPFTLLVSVVLSAQSTDKKVNQISPTLFARASTPEQMAGLEVATIKRLIRRIGLSSTKARNIKALSQKLVKEHAGQVPQTLEELEALPGVGHKSAQVVLAQAFGLPAFPVDTHIHRLAQRWGLSAARNVSQTERDLKRLFPRERWNVLHLQIIFFGRYHCPAMYHDHDGCPICSWATTKARRKLEARREAEIKRKAAETRKANAEKKRAKMAKEKPSPAKGSRAKRSRAQAGRTKTARARK